MIEGLLKAIATWIVTCLCNWLIKQHTGYYVSWEWAFMFYLVIFTWLFGAQEKLK